MNPQTSTLLTRLDDYEWFRNVGVPVSDGTVIAVASWQDAIDHCSSEEWEYLQQEMANVLGLRIEQCSPKRHRKWNEIADRVKPVAVSLVSRKIESVVRENELPRSFRVSVEADIILAFMECEYADFVPPDFYGNQAYWYEQGHFPCGWEGIYPEGKLIIY